MLFFLWDSGTFPGFLPVVAKDTRQQFMYKVSHSFLEQFYNIYICLNRTASAGEHFVYFQNPHNICFCYISYIMKTSRQFGTCNLQ